MKKDKLSRLTLSAMFLGLALVLPFLTGQIPKFGSMLLPMHIPALLCGFVCGWPWGLAVGFMSPLLRSLIFTMPSLYPVALAMAFEIAVYGAVSGLVYEKLPKSKANIYVSLVVAMLVGRLVWGAAMFVLLAAKGGSFTFAAFMASAFTNAMPGIILQIVLIPALVMALEKSKLVGARH